MPRTRRTRPLLATALGALALTALGPLTPTANAGLQHAAVVSDRPVGWTPHVLDGSVKDILRVGDTIVVGGDFSRVSDFRGNELRRTNLFAFEHDSGRIIHDFAPRTDGTVVSLAPAPTAPCTRAGRSPPSTGTPSAASHGCRSPTATGTPTSARGWTTARSAGWSRTATCSTSAGASARSTARSAPAWPGSTPAATWTATSTSRSPGPAAGPSGSRRSRSALRATAWSSTGPSPRWRGSADPRSR